MAWEHLSITKPHLVYILLGAFTTLFMLCSSFIKERMYIGEATVATIFGVIFGPHAADLINPLDWGSVDLVTLEFSRIVLVVQCFAVGVELPKFYMERHWRSVVYLLVPVMATGWLVVSLVVWWMVPRLSWLQSLVVAACVTATDPVLASSVVGKGKFATRVPKHLRDILSAESGCNDGMAFPFVYLALYLIQFDRDPGAVAFHWICYTILYECVFGAVFGFTVGYLARHGIKWAHERDMIDRESFLVFYFVVALFCAGSGSILGVDDLLVGFAAGVGFSNDGWFGEKTEESHVSNVIDLLLNLTYFVYLGTIIPWEQYNNADLGLSAWRLSVLAIFVILFRRIPVMMLLKPFIPDIRNWREAMFAGHFGPIGVGAIFVAILARSELEHHSSVPLSTLPPQGADNHILIVLVWPIVTFLVIASMIVHGSSVAVFTLGKHINTLTITMSYTQQQAQDEGPSWMNRLPRISSISRSQAKTMSDTEADDVRATAAMPDYPPGALPPIGLPGHFLRRQREEEPSSRPNSRASSLLARRRKKRWDDGIGPGGPVSQSAIFPAKRPSPDTEKEQQSSSSSSQQQQQVQQPQEGQPPPPQQQRQRSPQWPQSLPQWPQSLPQSPPPPPAPRREDTADTQGPGRDKEKEADKFDDQDITPVEGPSRSQSPPARVEVFSEGDHVVVEDEEGEVLATDESPGIMDEGTETTPKRPTHARVRSKSEGEHFNWTLAAFKKKFGDVYAQEMLKRTKREKTERHHTPARAYQFGNTIIVEDEDGEVVKTYELPAQKPDGETTHGSDMFSQGLKMMGLGGLTRVAALDHPLGADVTAAAAAAKAGGESSTAGERAANWTAAWAAGRKKAPAEDEQEDDKHIRFKIAGVGQRMTKEDFIKEVQKLDARTRREVVDQSSAPPGIKRLAKGVGGGGDGGAAAPPPNRPPQAVDDDDDDDLPRGRSISTSPLPPSPSGARSGGGNAARPHRGKDRAPVSNPAAAPVDTDETPVERRRRLAVLASQGDNDTSETPAERRRREAVLASQGDNDTSETPAERRRREAALRDPSEPDDDGEPNEDDSDDEAEGGMRVPPASRRGIRFADVPERGRR